MSKCIVCGAPLGLSDEMICSDCKSTIIRAKKVRTIVRDEVMDLLDELVLRMEPHDPAFECLVNNLIRTYSKIR